MAFEIGKIQTVVGTGEAGYARFMIGSGSFALGTCPSGQKRPGL